jgi:hypothetical protein
MSEARSSQPDLDRLSREIQEILADTREILAFVKQQTTATQGHFDLDGITNLNLTTGAPIIMAENLLDDQISNIPVVYDNIAGQPVAAPSGGAPSVSIDNAAAGTVVVGANSMSVDFSPTQPAVDGTAANITWTDKLTDGTSITIGPLAIVVTADTTATSGAFNVAGITNRPLGT